uniref:Putative secreted protein n=1 Tax=Amblyomma cajennense TaxID=34607 RepID=A0A023FSN6_AMBCJ
MTSGKLLSFALLVGAVVAIIGTSSAGYFSHETEFGAVAFNGPYPCGTCVRDGALSYGCPAGAVCVPDGAHLGVWAGPGTCFWAV